MTATPIPSKTSETTMTLENMLQKSLAKPPDPGGASVSIAHRGWNVTIRPETGDALGCALWEVALERDAPAATDVRAWAGRISSRATGLLEPLKLHEVDADAQVALLRSTSPTPRDDGLLYTEVELRGTARAIVRRYRGFHDTGRK